MDKNCSSFKKLTEADNDVQANLVINLLENNGINAIAKGDSRLNTAKAYTGLNMPGISIFVNEEDYREAYEIVSSVNMTEKQPIQKKYYSNTQKWIARALLGIGLIILIINLINYNL